MLTPTNRATRTARPALTDTRPAAAWRMVTRLERKASAARPAAATGAQEPQGHPHVCLLLFGEVAHDAAPTIQNKDAEVMARRSGLVQRRNSSAAVSPPSRRVRR
jgi:hypothetical protein